MTKVALVIVRYEFDGYLIGHLSTVIHSNGNSSNNMNKIVHRNSSYESLVILSFFPVMVSSNRYNLTLFGTSRHSLGQLWGSSDAQGQSL